MCNEHTVSQALAKPAAAFGGVELYADLPTKIAALLYGLAKSQACIEGNKRVALLLTIAFTRTNGADLRLQQDEMADEILRIANTPPEDHDAVIAETTAWVTERLVEDVW
jgi:death-on-curing family protein